jgi:hypothetical protein
MKFGVIKSRVLSNLGRGSANVLVNDWINNRQSFVCSDRNWYFLKASTTQALTEVATSTSYDLPSDYKDDAIFYLIKSGETKPSVLRIIDEKSALLRYSTDDIGTPRWIVMKDTQYTPYPAANGAYTLYLEYYKWLTDLKDDGDTNEITNRKPDLLIAGGTAEGFSYLQEYNDANQWERLFQKHLSDFKAHDVSRKLGQDFMLVPRPDADKETISPKTIPPVLEDWY